MSNLFSQQHHDRINEVSGKLQQNDTGTPAENYTAIILTVNANGSHRIGVYGSSGDIIAEYDNVFVQGSTDTKAVDDTVSIVYKDKHPYILNASGGGGTYLNYNGDGILYD